LSGRGRGTGTEMGERLTKAMERSEDSGTARGLLTQFREEERTKLGNTWRIKSLTLVAKTERRGGGKGWESNKGAHLSFTGTPRSNDSLKGKETKPTWGALKEKGGSTGYAEPYYNA